MMKRNLAMASKYDDDLKHYSEPHKRHKGIFACLESCAEPIDQYGMTFLQGSVHSAQAKPCVSNERGCLAMMSEFYYSPLAHQFTALPTNKSKQGKNLVMRLVAIMLTLVLLSLCLD